VVVKNKGRLPWRSFGFDNQPRPRLAT